MLFDRALEVLPELPGDLEVVPLVTDYVQEGPVPAESEVVANTICADGFFALSMHVCPVGQEVGPRRRAHGVRTREDSPGGAHSLYDQLSLASGHEAGDRRGRIAG